MMKVSLSKRRSFLLVLSFFGIIGTAALYKYYSSYDSPPFLGRQIDNRCPYYSDFRGRVHYKSTCSSIFVIFGPHTCWYKLNNIDGNNFKVVKTIDDGSGNLRCVAADGSRVIYQLRTIEGADPETFQIIKSSEFEYYKDKDFVFFGDKKIEGADPNTFELILIHTSGRPPESGGYARDKNSVYYLGKKLKDADINTFEVFWDEYQLKGRDKQSVYFRGLVEQSI